MTINTDFLNCDAIDRGVINPAFDLIVEKKCKKYFKNLDKQLKESGATEIHTYSDVIPIECWIAYNNEVCVELKKQRESSECR